MRHQGVGRGRILGHSSPVLLPDETIYGLMLRSPFSLRSSDSIESGNGRSRR